MSYNGHVIKAKNLSDAWIQAVNHIILNRGECWNLMVQIENPTKRKPQVEKALDDMTRKHRLLSIKQVAYTIFPHGLYAKPKGTRDELYERYDRMDRMIRAWWPARRRWGTYFKRMIDWPFGEKGKRINQLDIIIAKLLSREKIYRCAYTITICSPERNFTQPIGAPCLNYLALQIEPRDKKIGLLAVYRNHDFIKRAYGNYIGLSNLQRFICEQSEFEVGGLTVLSSHAFINSPPSRKELKGFLEEIS